MSKVTSNTTRFPVTSLSIVVFLVAVHSIILGIVLIAAPKWLLSVFEWSIVCDAFFLQQAGLFHILLGLVYLVEFFAHGGVGILLTAKSCAVVFLTIQYLWRIHEPAVLMSGLVDAGMALIVFILWWNRTNQDN
jgi:hypothetical protein